VRREYAVDLACGACEAAVTRALAALPGVASCAACAASQTVVVEGEAPPEAVLAALAATGRAARLIGQGAADGARISH
jgi:copper chaperone CopZ